MILILTISPVHSDVFGSVITILRDCTDTSNDMITVLKKNYCCIYKSFNSCLLHYSYQRKSLHNNYLCGIITSKELLKPHTWTIEVHTDYATNVTFDEFHLPCTTNCRKALVRLYSLNTVTLTYCGYRLPWSIVHHDVLTTLQYMFTLNMSKMYSFSLFYEAVDVMYSKHLHLVSEVYIAQTVLNHIHAVYFKH